jgi:hypothetical protein
MAYELKNTNNTAGKGSNVLLENLSVLMTPEGVQKYILGTKKNGAPRAVYDVVKDYTEPKKKKKGKKKKGKKKNKVDVPASYSFYLSTKSSKKKKKDKKKDKHWHI